MLSNSRYLGMISISDGSILRMFRDSFISKWITNRSILLDKSKGTQRQWKCACVNNTLQHLLGNLTNFKLCMGAISQSNKVRETSKVKHYIACDLLPIRNVKTRTLFRS